MNYLALLGWAPSGGTRETFTPRELVKEFSLKRITPSSAVFDMEKLYWLNRHYLKKSPPARVAQLALPYFQRAGLLPEQPNEQISQWFGKLMALLVPYVDKLEQLPEKAAQILRYPAPSAIEKLMEQIYNDSFITTDRFKAIMAEIEARTGVKGKDLFHPVRIVLIGSPSGPAFDQLIPLLEEGSRLPLPEHVKSVRERVSEFMDFWRKRQG